MKKRGSAGVAVRKQLRKRARKMMDETGDGSEGLCPYECEECSDAGRCDRCKMDAFVSDVARLIFGMVPEQGSVTESMILAELQLLVQKGKDAQKENTELKARSGKLAADVDKAKVDLLQSQQKERVGSDVAIRASNALSRMQAAYGDDLTWENVVERTTGALVRLQSQAPLMQAAESELERMRARLAQLEAEDSNLNGAEIPHDRIPHMPGFRSPGFPPFPPIPSGSPVEDCGNLVSGRLESLEQDLAFFRLIGKIGGRLLGLDRRSGKR